MDNGSIGFLKTRGGRLIIFVSTLVFIGLIVQQGGLLPNSEARTNHPLDINLTPIIAGAFPTTTIDSGPTPTRSPFTPTVTPPPFQFVFPTPAAAPVSAWRPPLYPVPWSPTPNDHFFFARPIAADQVNWPVGNYRYGGVFFENVIHTGVDIVAPPETPVYAAGSGKILWAGWGLYSGIEDQENDAYGIAVAIKHDFGYEGNTLFTVYGHMSRVDVIRGQHVETGDLLGAVGETGFVTGPHLHFEVRMGDNNFFSTFNPELWMAPPQGWGVLSARIMGTGGQLLFNQPVYVRSKATGRMWAVSTYGETPGINSDGFYRENLVMGDLPAGKYDIEIGYLGRTNRIDIEISPGLVSYFTFRGQNGFFFDLPTDRTNVFIPPDATASPIPSPTFVTTETP